MTFQSLLIFFALYYFSYFRLLDHFKKNFWILQPDHTQIKNLIFVLFGFFGVFLQPL